MTDKRAEEFQMTQFMRFIAGAACTALLLASKISVAALPADTTIAPMLNQVLPSIVNIKARIKVTDINMLREIQKQQRGNDKSKNETPDILGSSGSGVIIDAKNGYIITNAHVIDGAESVVIHLSDGHHYTAKVIGIDKPSDVAIVQIKAKNLTSVNIGDSNTVKVGDFVAAIGNPFGLNQTVTSGIVSALGRTTLGIENYENFIQTDASINPGNSGGALINMKGELIGINTAILAPDRGSIGIGFAIPSNMAKSVMLQLIEYGNVKRGVLGIGAQDITPELADAFDIENKKGAVITQILANSPAQLSGLKVGDIITSINTTDIKSASDVVNTVGFLRVDSKVNVNILRQHKPITVTVLLSDPKKRQEQLEINNPFLNGVGLKNFDALSPIHGNVKAVLVTAVDRESNAWNSELRPGDIITSANQQPVTNIDELKAAVQKNNKFLLVNILRGQGAAFLVINKEP